MARARPQQSHETPQPSLLRVADLTVDLERRSVRRDTEALDLPDRSFALLAALLRYAPETVSKDQLIREVWDDAVVSDETLTQRVRLLRQSLGDDSQNPKYIMAVRGRGYRLVAAVAKVDALPARGKARRIGMVAAAALTAALALTWQLMPRHAPDVAAGDFDALAVLPFADISGGQNHQFFADGMHEELLSRLATIDGLQVTSRTSVERYRGTDSSLPSIARQLGVDAVVEGSIRVDGDRLRVTVQLIDAATDAHRWARSYDRQLSMQDIFALQAEVANEIAEALRLEHASTSDRSDLLPTNSIEAYNLYLLGRYHTFRQTRDDLEKAVEFLQQAIGIDAEFAAAYAALGWAYSFLGSEYGNSLPHETYPKAKEAALRALSIDANLSDARTLYADILTWYDWDFVAAEREYLNTVELDPLNVLGYALFLSTQERHEEAIALIERRVAAHPNDPYVRINAGWRYYHAGMPDKAIAAATATAEHRDSLPLLGLSRLVQGNTGKAIEVFEAAVEAQGETPSSIANLAMAYYRHGRRGDADGLLVRLEAMTQSRHVSPGVLANVYFAAGDADRGFALLERALAQRARDMIFLRVNRMLDGYRDDPRYLELVRRIGLE